MRSAEWRDGERGKWRVTNGAASIRSRGENEAGGSLIPHSALRTPHFSFGFMLL